MAHYNRRQRRELGKAMGMLGKNGSPKQWRERIRRSQEAGRQIDRQFKNTNETNLRNAAAEAETVQLNSFIEKFGKERAEEIMANNRDVINTRKEKLEKRRAKQKAAYELKQKK